MTPSDECFAALPKASSATPCATRLPALPSKSVWIANMGTPALRRLSGYRTVARACPMPSCPTSSVRSIARPMRAIANRAGWAWAWRFAERVARVHGGSIHAENRLKAVSKLC